MKISNLNDLRGYFIDNKSPLTDGVYVSTKIRNEWMLNHERVIVRGNIYNIQFENKGSGIWYATLLGKED